MAYEWMRPSEVFAIRLRATRKARGMNQSELAERMIDSGRPLSQPALLRIEALGRPNPERKEQPRGLQLDEAIGLAACLNAAPAALLTPPEGALLALTDKLGVHGDALRNWLVTGNPILAAPTAPSDEDRATLDEILKQSVTVYAQALVDAVRAHDEAGKAVVFRAIVEAFSDHRAAVEAIEASRG